MCTDCEFDSVCVFFFALFFAGLVVFGFFGASDGIAMVYI